MPRQAPTAGARTVLPRRLNSEAKVKPQIEGDPMNHDRIEGKWKKVKGKLKEK
jgi:hypothetical protein